MYFNDDFVNNRVTGGRKAGADASGNVNAHLGAAEPQGPRPLPG